MIPLFPKKPPREKFLALGFAVKIAPLCSRTLLCLENQRPRVSAVNYMQLDFLSCPSRATCFLDMFAH